MEKEQVRGKKGRGEGRKRQERKGALCSETGEDFSELARALASRVNPVRSGSIL